jgi:hypothetical protein
MRWWPAIVAVVGTAAIGGCGGGETAAKPSRPAATPADTLARCSQPIALSFGEQISPETGEHGVMLRLTNRGAASCTLLGHPTVRLSADGRRLPFRFVHGAGYYTQGSPKPVRIAPRRSAYVLVAKYRCDGETIATADEISIRLPQMPHALRLAFPTTLLGGSYLSYCGASSGPDARDPGNVVTLSPVRSAGHRFG